MRSSPLATGLAAVCSLSLGGTAYAVAPAPVETRPAVCGGLAADADFAAEAIMLGRGHACEHLRVRNRAERRAAVQPSTTSAVRAPAMTVRAAAGGPAQSGRWSAARNPGTRAVGIAAVLVHTGEVLLFGDVANTGLNTSGYLFDPVTGTGHDVPAPAPIFCGSLTPLSDGRILSVGGSDPNPRGIEDVWLFDPATEQWLEQPPTPEGRYYPTSTKLPDGRVLLAAGTQLDGSTQNPNIELYTPPAAGGGLGTLEVVGPEHPTTTYPHQIVMPDGRMMQVARTRTFVLDTRTWGWRNLRRQAPLGEGSAHLVLPGGTRGSNRVMVMGGMLHGNAQALTQYFDYGSPAAGWRRGRPMPTPRAHMNVVQVPDGSAYAIGGNSTGLSGDGQHQTMHFDPATGRWRNVAVQGPRRAYHSTALLLPDGRIMSSGDDDAGGGQQRIDFYSPPYLFKGARPRVTFAPRRVRYGGRFAIRTAGPSVTRAVLMAPGSTTHANEMNARHVPLRISRGPRGFTATVPKASAAPPGHYMLFVLTADGVPSVARWVRVAR